MPTIPIIDPSVRHVGVSRLRQLNVAALRELTDTLVVQDEKGARLAVIVSWDVFLEMQRLIEESKSLNE